MTNGQKKILNSAFVLLVAGAKKGQRLVQEDATAGEIKAHVDEIALMVAEVSKALGQHVGASAVLARAKPLSSSRGRSTSETP